MTTAGRHQRRYEYGGGAHGSVCTRPTPKVGLRTTRANELWHIDTNVIRLLDGTRAYVHAVNRGGRM